MQYEHRQGMKSYCEKSRADFMPMCDWYTVRNDDGAYLGFSGHPDGDAKILVMAHLDYLQSGVVSVCNRKKIVSSALDDRAGVYIAFEMLDEYGIKADILLTDEEECGNSTAADLGAGMLSKYNWIVQLDRRGEDVVTYGYTELEPFLSEFWEVQRGSMSCIAKLEEISPVSAFNMGVGYFGEHSDKCHLSWKVLHRQLGRLKKFYDKYVDHRFTRDHKVGEVRDYERVYKAPTYGYGSGWAGRQDYRTHTPNVGAIQKGLVHQPSLIPDGKGTDWCAECGCALAVGEDSLCWWCESQRKPKEVKDVLPDEGSSLVLVSAESCDLCLEMTNTIYHISDHNWWVCGDCYETAEKHSKEV